MNRFLIGVDVVDMRLILPFFPEGYGVVNWVIRQFYHVCCLVLEGVVFAVELHLKAVPGITVRTH